MTGTSAVTLFFLACPFFLSIFLPLSLSLPFFFLTLSSSFGLSVVLSLKSEPTDAKSFWKPLKNSCLILLGVRVCVCAWAWVCVWCVREKRRERERERERDRCRRKICSYFKEMIFPTHLSSSSPATQELNWTGLGHERDIAWLRSN